MSNPQSKLEPFDLEDLFGPVIHSYSRAEALDDGALVDVNGLRAEIRRGFAGPPNQ